MTNEQMYILIGVPGILALVGILVNATIIGHISTAVNGRMTSLENRIGGVESRIGGVEARIGGLENRMLNLENTFIARFDLLMGRLMDLERDIHNR